MKFEMNVSIVFSSVFQRDLGVSCKTTFLEGARTYRYYSHRPPFFCPKNMHRVPIQIVSFSNDRDPAGPEHHWVARKQVKRTRLYFAELFREDSDCFYKNVPLVI